MPEIKHIFVIIGSASADSANLKLAQQIATLTREKLNLNIYNDLKSLPHFDPELSTKYPPQQIIALRNAIENADGVIICTPEYIFSLPSGLKKFSSCLFSSEFKRNWFSLSLLMSFFSNAL